MREKTYLEKKTFWQVITIMTGLITCSIGFFCNITLSRTDKLEAELAVYKTDFYKEIKEVSNDVSAVKVKVDIIYDILNKAEIE